jgi:DNA-binding XRE family transcriptional regulator
MGTLPRNVAHFRALLKWTQAQLAKASGISRNTISALERGKLVNVQLLTVLALCRPSAFDVTLDQLTGMDRKWDGKTSTPCHRCSGHMDGSLHRVPDCIVSLYERGFSKRQIATKMEFGILSVRAIIADEYAMKRRS